MVLTSWRVWKFRASGWLSAVDTRFRHLLPAAERTDTVLEVVADEVVPLDTFLFTQLLVWLEGKQPEMLLRGPENRGLEGWRTLVRAQERLEPTDKLLSLKSCYIHSSETEVLGDGNGCRGKQNAYDIQFCLEECSPAT